MKLIYAILRLVLAVVFCLLGLMVALTSFSARQLAEASAHWPSTHGTVLSTSIEEHMVRSSKYYMPHVNYEFKVSKKDYKGKLLTDPEPDCSTKAEAELMLKQYPVKGKVTVYYDPADPEQSRLIKGETSDSQTSMYIGIGFFLLSLIFLITRVKGVLKAING